MFEIREIPSNLKSPLEKLFSDNPGVDLSIPSILEGQRGKCITIRTDHMTNPTAVQIEHGTFTVFAGTPDRATAIKFIEKLKSPCGIQPSTGNWIPWIKEIYPDNTATYKRYSLSASSLDRNKLFSLIGHHPCRDKIKSIDLAIAEQLNKDERGQYHLLNYEHPADFAGKAMGYVIIEDDIIAAACTSAFVCSKGIEFNIVTHPGFRNQGLATIVAAKLIIDCLDKGLEPHWDAANEISRKLALKLGYEDKSIYEMVVYK